MATKHIILVLALAIWGLLISCASQQELRKIPPPSPLEMVQPTAAYIIQPGDQLDIKFFYNPELNESVTVMVCDKKRAKRVPEKAFNHPS